MSDRLETRAAVAEPVAAPRRRGRLAPVGTGVACAVGCCAVPLVAGAGIGALASCAAPLLGAGVLAAGAVGASRATRRSAASPSRLRLWFAVALVASAGLFAVGVGAERSHHDEGRVTRGTETAEATGHEEAGRGTEARETVLGVNPESGPIVAVVVAASVLMAIAVTRRPGRLLLGLAVLFCSVAAAFDAAEVVHQLSNAEVALAALAAAVTAAHLVAAAIGGLAFRRRAA